MEKASDYLNFFDNFGEVVLNDTERQYIARKKSDNEGKMVILIKHNCDGFTWSNWDTWKEDPIAIQKLLCGNRLTSIELPEDEDHNVFLLTFRMPQMV